MTALKMTALKKFIFRTVAVAIISVAPSNAALSIGWDFSPGNENGWTTVNGVSWLDGNGVEAGQANGVGDNATGNTRKGHD
ncbi:hypothetical protein GYB43_16520, partial [bacterium]|nr:hypothetical protein [bacterium]